MEDAFIFQLDINYKNDIILIKKIPIFKHSLRLQRKLWCRKNDENVDIPKSIRILWMISFYYIWAVNNMYLLLRRARESSNNCTLNTSFLRQYLIDKCFTVKDYYYRFIFYINLTKIKISLKESLFKMYTQIIFCVHSNFMFGT